jgi:antirestriction protein ArdC
MPVGEFGAAFLCAMLEVMPEVSKLHAANIARWLRGIKRDRPAALSLAIHNAGTAVEYLHALGREVIPAR